jgi:hypothetical protein
LKPDAKNPPNGAMRDANTASTVVWVRDSAMGDGARSCSAAQQSAEQQGGTAQRKPAAAERPEPDADEPSV